MNSRYSGEVIDFFSPQNFNIFKILVIIFLNMPIYQKLSKVVPRSLFIKKYIRAGKVAAGSSKKFQPFRPQKMKIFGAGKVGAGKIGAGLTNNREIEHDGIAKTDGD